MQYHHIIVGLPDGVQRADLGGHGAAFFRKAEAAALLRRVQQGQVHRPAVFLYAVFVAEFPVVGGGEGVKIGKIIPGTVHIRQRFPEARPDTAPAAVLGQGRDAPDASHFAGAAVKLHGEIGDGEGTHHFPVLVEGRPVGGVVLLRVGGTVGVGHFKADGEQLVDSPGFLQSGFPYDHFSSSSGSM